MHPAERVTLEVFVEDYIQSATRADSASSLEATSKLELIKQELKRLSSDFFNARWQPNFLPKVQFPENALIRKVILSNNQPLIKLFAKYLPRSYAHMFSSEPLPESIVTSVNQKAEIIAAFVKRNIDKRRSLNELEYMPIMLQRIIRARYRTMQEINRIMNVYKLTKAKARAAIRQANIPYRPQGCSSELADRIMQAAAKVQLFSTIKHLTAANALGKIFDDCIYGQKTLLQFNLPFRRAALHSDDIMNGDGNAICFGPQYIDPQCLSGITAEITLKTSMLDGRNHCMFFKQRDFGYAVDRMREVTLGDSKLYFSHTSSLRIGNLYHSNLQLFSVPKFYDYSRTHYSELPNYNFIATDIFKMHQILTLNFFRFIDILRSDDGIAAAKTRAIYAEIEKLSDWELENFLQDLGRQMTDTTEFNFYGAYRVDFDAIRSIAIYTEKTKTYELNMWDFTSQLQRGNLSALHEAREKIPTLFASYRFIDYLLSNSLHENTVRELTILRAGITTPPWLSLYEQARARGSLQQQASVTVTSDMQPPPSLPPVLNRA